MNAIEGSFKIKPYKKRAASPLSGATVKLHKKSVIVW